MSASPLITYLNNHLAGSVAAIELLEHGIRRETDSPLEVLFSELLPEITADQATLRELIEQLDEKESGAKKAVAWLGEKLSRITRDTAAIEAGVPLSQFEEVEALALGILGKRSLWSALRILARTDPRLQALDYEKLITRAEEQYARVEDFRLTIAHAALTAPAG